MARLGEVIQEAKLMCSEQGGNPYRAMGSTPAWTLYLRRAEERLAHQAADARADTERSPER